MRMITKNFFSGLLILLICGAAFWGSKGQFFTKVEAATAHHSSFTDIANNYWAFWYLEADKQLSIINSFSDGGFHPEATISKGEATVWLVEAAGIPQCCTGYSGSEVCDSICAAATFSDVPESNQYFPWIQAAKEAGILTGIYSGSTFSPGASLTQGQASQVIGNITGATVSRPPSYTPAYSAAANVTRAQMASLIAWNFNLPLKLGGTTYKTVLDENNQPVYGDEILSGAVLKIWQNGTVANPDQIVRSDQNGNYSVNLNVKVVTNNVKIQSYDPEKNFPAVTIGQQIAQDRSLIPIANAAGSSLWNVFHQKKSDCTKNLYDRVLQLSDQESKKWSNLQTQLDLKYIDWTDQQVYDEVYRRMREFYTGNPEAYCCTGFTTFVLTKAGLVYNNNSSFFSSDPTTLVNYGSRILGAKNLREWFSNNNDKELTASNGNIYKIKYLPKKFILQDLNRIQEGQIFLKLAPQGADHSGHTAVFVYPTGGDSIANTINCDGPSMTGFIDYADRDLLDPLFYGAGGFECRKTQ